MIERLHEAHAQLAFDARLQGGRLESRDVRDARAVIMQGSWFERGVDGDGARRGHSGKRRAEATLGLPDPLKWSGGRSHPPNHPM